MHPIGVSTLYFAMATIGERIAAAREARGLSRRDLADAAGVTVHAIGQIETGSTKNPKPENLFAIADRLGINPRALVYGEGNAAAQRENSGSPMPPIRHIPVLTWHEAAELAHGRHAARERGPSIAMAPPPGLSVSRDAFALVQTGDAMAPVVPDGAAVVLDPAADLAPPCVALVSHGGAIALRHVVADGGRTWLRAANPAYPAVELGNGDRVIARAVAVVSRL